MNTHLSCAPGAKRTQKKKTEMTHVKAQSQFSCLVFVISLLSVSPRGFDESSNLVNIIWIVDSRVMELQTFYH